MPWDRWKASTTWSASPARISPVSTNTQVNWGPMARWTSAAATAESTPPDNPQMARSDPTRSRMAFTEDSTTEVIVQSPGQAQTSCTNREMSACPQGVWWTSGWNCTP